MSPSPLTKQAGYSPSNTAARVVTPLDTSYLASCVGDKRCDHGGPCILQVAKRNGKVVDGCLPTLGIPRGAACFVLPAPTIRTYADRELISKHKAGDWFSGMATGTLTPQ